MEQPIKIPTEQEPVVLRELTPADAEAYFASVDASRAHLSQFGDNTAAKYPTLESVRNSIVRPDNPYKISFGIWSDCVFVGSANLTVAENGRFAEVGYWLDQRRTGNGYATLATRALARYAKNEYPHLRNIFAVVVKGNELSASVLKRSGFILAAEGADKLVFDFTGE